MDRGGLSALDQEVLNVYSYTDYLCAFLPDKPKPKGLAVVEAWWSSFLVGKLHEHLASLGGARFNAGRWNDWIMEQTKAAVAAKMWEE